MNDAAFRGFAAVEVIHDDEKYEYGSWKPKPYGRLGYAYNSVEDPNDGAGIEGNGLDLDQLQRCCADFMEACCDGAVPSSSGAGPCNCRLLPVGVNARENQPRACLEAMTAGATHSDPCRYAPPPQNSSPPTESSILSWPPWGGCR